MRVGRCRRGGAHSLEVGDTGWTVTSSEACLRLRQRWDQVPVPVVIRVGFLEEGLQGETELTRH